MCELTISTNKIKHIAPPSNLLGYSPLIGAKNGKSAVYLYGNTGLISNYIDRFKNTRTKYTYDLANRLVGVREYSGTQLRGNILISSAKYNYEDKTNRLIETVRQSQLGGQSFNYTYGNTLEGQNPDAVYAVSYNGADKNLKSGDEGKTACDYAMERYKERGKNEIIALLEN